jgi:hypothetical protein
MRDNELVQHPSRPWHRLERTQFLTINSAGTNDPEVPGNITTVKYSTGQPLQLFTTFYTPALFHILAFVDFHDDPLNGHFSRVFIRSTVI